MLVAGKHFGQSSGRAIATKAVKATRVGCVVAEDFARTFYRNAINDGLPIIECPDLYPEVQEGDEVKIDLAASKIQHGGKFEDCCQRR